MPSLCYLLSLSTIVVLSMLMSTEASFVVEWVTSGFLLLEAGLFFFEAPLQ
jgi:hypothetical protein